MQRNIYEEIKEAATRKGLSISALGREIGMSYASIEKIQRMQLGKTTLAKITNYLSLDYDDLLKEMQKLPTQTEYNAERKRLRDLKK